MTTSPPAPAASTPPGAPPVSNKTAGHKVEEARGSSYGPTIKLIHDQERARKTSLESRGAAIITTSGALATLLTGLVTFTRGNVSAFHLAIDKNAVWALIAAAVSFGLAAVLGLAQTSHSSTKRRIRTFWKPELKRKNGEPLTQSRLRDGTRN